MTPENKSYEYASDATIKHPVLGPVDLSRAYLAGYAAANEWVSVKDREPEQYQQCLFVVVSHDKQYNSRVLAGSYQGCRGDYHGFAMPGIEFAGEYWMPVPVFTKK